MMELRPLRVLMVEDDPNDAELLARKLRSGGFAPVSERVERLEDVRRALGEEQWDIVLSDHSMPGFRSIDVLGLLKSHGIPTPLIIVSGAIGEEEVVEALHLGAASYVNKNSLARLIPTIERALADAALRREHELARQRIELVQAAVGSTNDLIFVLEVHHGVPTKVLYVNAAERITGYTSEELHERGLLALSGPLTDPAAAARLRSAMKRGQAASSELLMYRKDGSMTWVESEIHPLAAGSNRFVAINRDISERKKLEAQMAFLATHDPLTGLANRALLVEKLDHELARAQRTGLSVAVLMLDLDGFKAVNDTRGHALGDRLLCDVADRLRASVRESDTVARIGGDEFVVVMGDLDGREAVCAAAERILESTRAPFAIGEELRQLSVSIGISNLPSSGEGGDELMKQADLAMYQVKANGKNAYRFSGPLPQAC